jgi:hypothetical protein
MFNARKFAVAGPDLAQHRETMPHCRTQKKLRILKAFSGPGAAHHFAGAEGAGIGDALPPSFTMIRGKEGANDRLTHR